MKNIDKRFIAFSGRRTRIQTKMLSGRVRLKISKSHAFQRKCNKTKEYTDKLQRRCQDTKKRRKTLKSKVKLVASIATTPFIIWINEFCDSHLQTKLKFLKQPKTNFISKVSRLNGPSTSKSQMVGATSRGTSRASQSLIPTKT